MEECFKDVREGLREGVLGVRRYQHIGVSTPGGTISEGSMDYLRTSGMASIMLRMDVVLSVKELKEKFDAAEASISPLTIATLQAVFGDSCVFTVTEMYSPELKRTLGWQRVY